MRRRMRVAMRMRMRKRMMMRRIRIRTGVPRCMGNYSGTRLGTQVHGYPGFQVPRYLGTLNGALGNYSGIRVLNFGKP